MRKEADEHERPAEVDEEDLETRDTGAVVTAGAGAGAGADVEVEGVFQTPGMEAEVEAMVGGVTTMTAEGVDDGDGLAPWTRRLGLGMGPRIREIMRSTGLM